MWGAEPDLEKEVENQYAKELNGSCKDKDGDDSIVPLLIIIAFICLFLGLVFFVIYLTEGEGKGANNINQQSTESTSGSNTYEPQIPSEVERELTGDWSSQ